jgi:hypothetical protein
MFQARARLRGCRRVRKSDDRFGYGSEAVKDFELRVHAGHAVQ